MLTVKNVKKTCEFYSKVLGMEVREFRPGRIALHFGAQKINLHAAGKPVDPNVKHATPGSADLCLLTSTPLDDVTRELKEKGVTIIEGGGQRTGARGPIRSLYLYDPDENLIEIANQL